MIGHPGTLPRRVVLGGARFPGLRALAPEQRDPAPDDKKKEDPPPRHIVGLHDERQQPAAPALAVWDHFRAQMGPSAPIRKVLERIERVAASPFTVLIEGETGAGKGLVARAIHHQSARRRRPFVAVDCGAIPEALFESEFFGHERGAFTGADRRKDGYFQAAHGGTLFLDELVNLPLSGQSKLLRAVQDRAAQPLGGRCPLRLDVRLVTACNVPLEQEVRAGRFRHDLYYRLKECSIALPPLRERREDILYLANRFLVETAAVLGRPAPGVSLEAADLLLDHAWPGNVRELKNVVREAVLLSRDVVRPEHLPGHLTDRGWTPCPNDLPVRRTERSLKVIANAAASQAERRAIRQALQSARGSRSAAARILQVDRKTLRIKMRRHGIPASEFRPA